MARRGSLLPIVQKFFELDPMAAAHSLETMEEESAIRALRSLPPALAAESFRFIDAARAADLLKELPPHLFAAIAQKLDPQQGASIFSTLPPDVQKNLLEHLPERSKGELRDLLTYPENSAGRIMTAEFLAFHSQIKVKDAVRRLRLIARKAVPASYLYVVDAQNKLIGIVFMRDLLIAEPHRTLEDIMRPEVYTVDPFMDREEVTHQLTERHFFAAPVVDAEHRMLGIVKSEQLISHVQEEATEDFQKLFGAGGDERPFSPMAFSLKKRLPWLHVNLATAFLAASVVNLFEPVIAKITILAVFLPVVAGQGGNAGAQSLAVVMRGLVMREIPRQRAWSLILKESRIGLLNGLIIGFVTSLVAWVWHGNVYLGIVIGLAMIVNLLAAGFTGAAIPILMKALGLDPAQSSSIIQTTVTDVVGFFSFLGFATIFQQYLL
jgi:magnesium transporter